MLLSKCWYIYELDSRASLWKVLAPKPFEIKTWDWSRLKDFSKAFEKVSIKNFFYLFLYLFYQCYIRWSVNRLVHQSVGGAQVFSRGHGTLQLAVFVIRSVCRSVRPSPRNFFQLWAIFTLLLLPNHPRLECRVSGLVWLLQAVFALLVLTKMVG